MQQQPPNKTTHRLQQKVKNSFKDPLFRNSFYLVLSRFINLGAGFLFWLAAAKLYSVEAVGRGTALISSLNLVMLLSPLGFDMSLIRFISEGDREETFYTVLSITCLAALAISLAYGAADSLLQSPLLQSLGHSLLFMLVAVFSSATLITGKMFLALRSAHYYLIQNLVLCLRLLLLPLLLHFNSFGIFLSLGLCYCLATFQSGFLLKKQGVGFRCPGVNGPFIRKSLKFSLGNYVSNNLNQAPENILPIMILHLLDSEAAAKYYIAFTLGNLTMTIPYALSTSLFVEGSHQQPLKENLYKALGAAYFALIPCVMLVCLFGKNILGFINPNYIGAFNLLRLVALSKFVEVLFVLFISVQNIRLKVKAVVKINLLYCTLLLALSYFFIRQYDIIGVGYAWLVSYLILTCLMLVEYWQERHMENKRRHQLSNDGI